MNLKVNITMSPERPYSGDLFIGVDTSCYTSSAACVCKDGIIKDERIVLFVAQGERGLRQSDAVFQHVRNLENIVPSMLNSIDVKRIKAIGVSSCPSGRENSYMPVFLAGKTLAKSIAAALNIPVFEFTHQQGHIRAALLGNEKLIGKEFFAFHLSGGTSDLLRVRSDFGIDKIGGSTDINAGQLVDRLGVKMGLPFPAGKELEKLASTIDSTNHDEIQNDFIMLPSSVKGFDCSFSGVETKVAGYIDSGANYNKIAFSIYDCIARTLAKMIKNSKKEYNVGVFLLAGGVASSRILRQMLSKRLKGENVTVIFSNPRLASDNAVGAALLAMDSFYKR